MDRAYRLQRMDESEIVNKIMDNKTEGTSKIGKSKNRWKKNYKN